VSCVKHKIKVARFGKGKKKYSTKQTLIQKKHVKQVSEMEKQNQNSTKHCPETSFQIELLNSLTTALNSKNK